MRRPGSMRCAGVSLIGGFPTKSSSYRRCRSPRQARSIRCGCAPTMSRERSPAMSLSAPEPKIGVVGAGLMGAEIALTFALGGMDVLLNDRDPAALDAALARLRALL